jgi:ABC-type phosphate/phosphonate transport system permease subunit
MKLTIFKSTVLALIVSSPISVMAAEPLSQAEGISNPIEAIVQIPATGIRIATGVAALPLMFVGEIGNISGQAGEALWEHANSSNSEPMHASDTKVLSNSNESFL